jgi:tetratricopeptide (TPR) repeat protein
MQAGRGGEAIAEIVRARDLDPRSLIVNSLVGFVNASARQYDRAIEVGEKVVQLDPNFAPGHYFLGGSLLCRGRYDEGIAHFRAAEQLTDGASLVSAGLGHALAVAGHREQARCELRELEERAKRVYVSPYGMAQVYAGLGEKISALDMLERAAKEHSFEMVFLKTDPSFDGLHEDARFQNLLKKVGFPE